MSRDDALVDAYLLTLVLLALVVFVLGLLLFERVAAPADHPTPAQICSTTTIGDGWWCWTPEKG